MNTEGQSLDDVLGQETEAAPAQEPEQQESETGVTSTAPPADAPTQQTRGDDGPFVPRKALEDERKKRQEYERQLEELRRPQQQPIQYQQPQLPAEAPDPFVDPNGYTQWVTQEAIRYAQVEAQRMSINRDLNRSERRARKEYGDELVDEAFQAAVKANVGGRFLESDDAYDDMVKWYKDYQIATNPEEYRSKLAAELEAEILAKHGLSPDAGSAAKSRAPVPKSLASTASARPRNELGQFAGPTPLDEIIG